MTSMQLALLLVPLKGTLIPEYGCQFRLEFARTREALEAPSLRCCPLPCPWVSRVEVIHPRDTQLGSQAKPAFQVTSALLLRENVYVCAEGEEGWDAGMGSSMTLVHILTQSLGVTSLLCCHWVTVSLFRTSL